MQDRLTQFLVVMYIDAFLTSYYRSISFIKCLLSNIYVFRFISIGSDLKYFQANKQPLTKRSVP